MQGSRIINYLSMKNLLIEASEQYSRDLQEGVLDARFHSNRRAVNLLRCAQAVTVCDKVAVVCRPIVDVGVETIIPEVADHGTEMTSMVNARAIPAGSVLRELDQECQLLALTLAVLNSSSWSLSLYIINRFISGERKYGCTELLGEKRREERINNLDSLILSRDSIDAAVSQYSNYDHGAVACMAGRSQYEHFNKKRGLISILNAELNSGNFNSNNIQRYANFFKHALKTSPSVNIPAIPT